MIPHMRDPMLTYKRDRGESITIAAVGLLGSLTAVLCLLGVIVLWTP